MLGAGVLLFVSAHWDELSPASRFSLVLLLVAGFHVVGAITSQRFSAFATTMHCLGTVALGAGIFLSGQIFNLQEHWPGGVMLWAIGAWLGWKMLPAVILLSSAVGATVGIALIVLARHGRHVPIPFGPYLAAAGMIALFWGEAINRAYLQSF